MDDKTEDFLLLENCEKYILSSNGINSKIDFIKDLETLYLKSSEKVMNWIICSLFRFSKDFSTNVRLEALKILERTAVIPNHLVLQTLSKISNEKYNAYTQSYVNAIESRLTDPHPEVRIAAIKALAATPYRDNKEVSSAIMKTIAQSLNDNSDKVRAEAVKSLGKISSTTNDLFSVEKSQIRMLVAMMEDRDQINRKECLSLIKILIVDDIQQVQQLIEGLSKSVLRYPGDFMHYFLSSYMLGKHNHMYFHMINTKRYSLLPQEDVYFNPYSLNYLVIMASVAAAYHVTAFPLPVSFQFNFNALQSISHFVENRNAISEYNIIDESFLKAFPQMLRYFKYEVPCHKDDIDYYSNEYDKNMFIQNMENSCFSKVSLNIISPKCPSGSIISEFIPASCLVINCMIELSPIIPYKVYSEITGITQTQSITEMVNTKSNIFECVLRLSFPNIFPLASVQVHFFFINNSNIRVSFDEYITLNFKKK